MDITPLLLIQEDGLIHSFLGGEEEEEAGEEGVVSDVEEDLGDLDFPGFSIRSILQWFIDMQQFFEC